MESEAISRKVVFILNDRTPSSAAPNGRATQMACEWKGRTVVIADASRLGVSCSALFG